MQLPAFNHNDAKWDQYRALHVGHINRYRWNTGSSYLMQFDTGEAIITNNYIHVSERRRHADFNISLLSPHDKLFPKVKLPDGTPVPITYLRQGRSQHFLIDHDSGHVVALGNTSKMADIPERFRGSSYDSKAKAYVHGSGRVPVGAPVRLSMTKKLTKEQRVHIANLRDLCRAWMHFSEDVDMENSIVMCERSWNDTKAKQPLTWTYMAGLSQDYLLTVTNLTDMDALDRCRLAVFGTYAIRERIEVSHLLVA